MKEKIHYAIEGALALAIISLFALHFTGNDSSKNTNVVVRDVGETSGVMAIAYIDLDSLMENYKYRLDVNELLTKKMESARLKINEQGNKLQTDLEAYQKKAETGSFVSRESQMNQAQQLQQRNENLQKLQESYAQELEETQLRLNIAMRQTIIAHIEEFNKEKGFHIIYGKMGESILYAKNEYSITTEVIDYLNRRYAADPSLKPKD